MSPDLPLYLFVGLLAVFFVFWLLDRTGKIPNTLSDRELAEQIAALREGRKQAEREAEAELAKEGESIDLRVTRPNLAPALAPDSGGSRVLIADTPRPRGAWKVWARTSVAGIRHHATAVKRFLARCRHAEPTRVGLDLQPDAENPHDPNAIRVYGYVDGTRFHLGYLPAQLAGELAAQAPPDMPISAHLQRVFRGDHVTDIVFHVLIPAQRNDFWQGRENPFAGPAGARAVWTGDD